MRWRNSELMPELEIPAGTWDVVARCQMTEAK
jgi:hypothetical protein